MRDAEDADARTAARRAILQHLARCPEAADTSDGVRNWWLPPELMTIPDRVVLGVLRDLVAEHVLKEQTLAGVGRVFSLDPAHAAASKPAGADRDGGDE